jgi:hypothetical protein
MNISKEMDAVVIEKSERQICRAPKDKNLVGRCEVVCVLPLGLTQKYPRACGLSITLQRHYPLKILLNKFDFFF